MKLTVTTPLEIVVEMDDVASVRAEDDSGAFGVMPGHADFVTVLSVSVVSWSDAAGARHHVAVRGGTLAVKNGRTIAIASREAVRGDDLVKLEMDVLARFRRQVSDEQAAHSDAQRLYLAAIRQIYRTLHPGVGSNVPVIPRPHDGIEA